MLYAIYNIIKSSIYALIHKYDNFMEYDED